MGGKMDLPVDDQQSLTLSKGVIYPEIIKALCSEQIEEQEAAVQRLFKLLSTAKATEANALRDAVIQADVIPRLVEYLHKDNTSLQFEAAWVLAKSVAGTSQQTQVVIDAGAVPVLIRLLHSKAEDIQVQAVWALAKIAGDSPKNRDLVLGAGIFPILLRMLSRCVSVKITRNAIWCLSNLCRGNPPPDFSKVRPVLPILAQLLYHSHEENLVNVCLTLSYLSEGCSENRQAVIDSGMCRKLVELLRHNHDSVSASALRTIGNIVTGDVNQKQVVIDCSALPSLLQLLGSTKESVRRQTCWVLTHICCGNQNQIQNVIDCNITPVLINILETPESEINTRIWAAWAIAKATSRGHPQQIRLLVNQNCIPPLCDLLTEKDSKIVQVVLSSLENILKVGESDAKLGSNDNMYAVIIEECGGLDNIKLLKIHENQDICQKAYAIIEHYFGAEENHDQLMSQN